MHGNEAGRRPARRIEARPLCTRYPEDRRRLLEAVQVKRGDDTLSETVAWALDRVVEEYFPGSVPAEARS